MGLPALCNLEDNQWVHLLYTTHLVVWWMGLPALCNLEDNQWVHITFYFIDTAPSVIYTALLVCIVRFLYVCGIEEMDPLVVL